MHIVFWEVEDDKELHICSSSSTSALSDNERNNSLNEGSVADGVLVHSPDQSLLIPHNDTDIICALTEDTSSSMDTTVTAGFDTSIGATTLLDTFEGLTHSEIITLTLVEVKPDVEMQSLNNNHKTLDLNTAGKNEILDSSSAAEGNKLHHCPSVDLPSTSSDPDSGDGSSSDPTFVPGARRGRGKGISRGKTVSRAKGKKVASSKVALHTSSSTSSEPCGVNCEQPVVPDTEDKSPSTEITQQGSLMSSTDNPPLSANESDPTSASLLDQNSRWSFLLSKHPLNQVQKSAAKFAPASDTQLKPPPPPPFHSTPNPVKRPHLPMALYPKPQLRTEDSEDLPVKAADMYGAFRAKSLNNQRPLLSPTVQSQPVTSNHLTTPTVISSTSLITPGAKALLKASLKRHGSHSSEVPVGLGSTEALRYKLLKQLKSRKKKQLARINKMLDKHEGLQLRPDSTDLDSPSTVTSSTYDGATSDDFLSDLLSPATTASNLSPDSTGFFEMFANGPDGAERVVEAAGRPSEMNGGTNGQHDENFLDEFLSQAASHTPTDMETEALSALELFI